MKLPSAIRIGLLVVATATLGACASIPQRALANGQGMYNSRAYQSIMNGNKSIQVHRALGPSLDPRRANFRQAAYQPFGDWWY